MKGARVESRITSLNRAFQARQAHESRRLASRHTQRGLSFFGLLVFLLIVGAGGYFAYQWYLERGDTPACKDDLTACMRMCRRLSTESAEAQKCQAACERDASECERKIGER